MATAEDEKLRKMARQRGLRMVKASTRDRASPCFAGYLLCGWDDHVVVLGATPIFGATAFDVQRFLERLPVTGAEAAE